MPRSSGRGSRIGRTNTVVRYRLFRFTVTACRSPSADSIQLSRIHLRRPDGETLSLKGAMLKGPSVSYPGSQASPNSANLHLSPPGNQLGEDHIVLTFPMSKEVDAFHFVTASDAPERDPVCWTVEGSTDGVKWAVLHSQETRFNTPEERLTATQWFGFRENSMAVPHCMSVADFLMSDEKAIEEAEKESSGPKSVSEWLQKLPLLDLLSKQLSPGATERSRLQAIQSASSRGDKSEFVQMLSDADVLENLAQVLYEGARTLKLSDEEPEDSVPAVASKGYRQNIVADTLRVVQQDVSQFMHSWENEETLLKSAGVITNPLAKTVDDQLGKIARQPIENLTRDSDLQSAISDAFAAKRWLQGAQAIESPYHFFQVLNRNGEELLGKSFWVLDDYEALSRAYQDTGTSSPMFLWQVQALGKTCEVVDVHTQLPCAWCSVELDAHEKAATGLAKFFQKAEALESGSGQFYAGMTTRLTASTGVDLSWFLRELRTRFEAGQVLLPLSMLVPRVEDVQAVLTGFPETQREACTGLLVARFLQSDLDKDSTLRYFMEMTISQFAGGRHRFLARLRNTEGDARVESALPHMVVCKELRIGSKRYDAVKITAAECRDAGYSPAEAKALGFAGHELATAWTEAKLESSGYSKQEINALLGLS